MACGVGACDTAAAVGAAAEMSRLLATRLHAHEPPAHPADALSRVLHAAQVDSRGVPGVHLRVTGSALLGWAFDVAHDGMRCFC